MTESLDAAGAVNQSISHGLFMCPVVPHSMAALGAGLLTQHLGGCRHECPLVDRPEAALSFII